MKVIYTMEQMQEVKQIFERTHSNGIKRKQLM